MATDYGGDGGWFWLWRGWFWSWRRQLVMNVGVVVTNWRKKRIGAKREWSIFFYIILLGSLYYFIELYVKIKNVI